MWPGKSLCLRVGQSGLPEFFHEHGERLVVRSIGAMADRDADGFGWGAER
jgi:hypothetical protein